MYRIKKISILNLIGQNKINNILFDCGKDMAKKYDLHHWDNSHLKNFIIILLCELKNSVYLVYEDKNPIATFQLNKNDNVLRFEKLACSPSHSGKGVGKYCMSYIEKSAQEYGCKKVAMEVYAPSQHALNFYISKGYKVCGETKTIKYSEVKMEKIL